MRIQITIFIMVLLFSLNHKAWATGDCNGDGTVTIAEVQSAINMFLGITQSLPCVDDDNSANVSIAEVQKTINTFLGLITTNTVPVANAGAAQSVVIENTVTLDGSASSDANNDTLTYSWSFTSKPVNSSATLSSSTVVKPTFTPDVAGVYVLSLTVNDGKASSSAASVNVTATSSTGSITVKW